MLNRLLVPDTSLDDSVTPSLLELLDDVDAAAESDYRSSGETIAQDLKEKPDMAQRVNIIVESDLSGEAGASTLSFGLDGSTYEIDLTADEAADFRETLSKYLAVARKVKGGRVTRRTSTAPNAATGNAERPVGIPPAKVRKWAKDNGYDLPSRGRIPAEVMEAYNAANPAA